MSVIEIFSCFLTSVFSLTWFFRGQKTQFLFEILSAGTYRSVILTFKKCLKSKLVLELPEFATHFSSKTKGSIFSSRCQSKAFYFYNGMPFENLAFVP